MCICNWIKALFRCKNQEKSIDAAKADAFVKTWSLTDFAKKHGKMQICKSPDKNNRESYLKCRFVDNKRNNTYVNVSSKMQSITVEELVRDRERIRVGQLPDGKYVLYDFRWKDWEDVEL